jgi:flagellar basal-body rod protein FlgB
MFEGTTFGKTVGLLSRSMDVAMLRRNVIADNIANAEVPNFKRSDVTFESSLKRALASENYKPELELSTTDDRHMPLYRPVDWSTVEPRRVLDYTTSTKANGSNVDAEEEFMASLKNQLSYTLMAQSANFEFSQVNSVMRSS